MVLEGIGWHWMVLDGTGWYRKLGKLEVSINGTPESVVTWNGRMHLGCVFESVESGTRVFWTYDLLNNN